MEKIKVLGLGPGNLDYTLPITIKKIVESDVIIGGKRHIESLGKYAENKEYCYITGDLQKVLDFINENRNKKMALILSGDTGFYSMLTFMRKHFKADELEVVPGISSIQYMFAKISDYWYDAKVSSLHGKQFDYVSSLKKYGKIAKVKEKKLFLHNLRHFYTIDCIKQGMDLNTIAQNLGIEDLEILKIYQSRDLKVLQEQSNKKGRRLLV